MTPSDYVILRGGETLTNDRNEAINCSDQLGSVYRLWDEFDEFVQDFLSCVRGKVTGNENDRQARPLSTNVGDQTEPCHFGQR